MLMKCQYVRTGNKRDEDPSRLRQHVRTHGVSFEEAQTVFGDDHAIRFYDPDHSDDGDRFIMRGVSLKLRILVACPAIKKATP